LEKLAITNCKKHKRHKTKKQRNEENDSQRVFIFVAVYFVIESVRKIWDTPSYLKVQNFSYHVASTSQKHQTFRSVYCNSTEVVFLSCNKDLRMVFG